MKVFTVTTAIALALSLAVPARADLKDVLIGAGIGAVATQVINNNRNNRNNQAQTQRQRQSTASTRATSSRATSSSRAQTLNSRYSRAERREIQTSLNLLGYNVGTVDGSLGANSRRGISEFQAARGESTTGQLTRPQFAALMSARSNPSAAFVVDRALNRDEVVLMQSGLQRLGFYNLAVDGSTGPGTRNARDNFLRAQGQNPVSTTQVQAAVLAANAAGIAVPPYLMQEAQRQFQQASAPAQTGFGQPQTQTAGFGQPQAIQPQLAQPQGQTALFGATPAAPQSAVPGQQTVLFGATPQQQAQPGAVQPQQGGQALFGTPAPQQQPGVAAATPTPAAPAGTSLFAAPTPTPVAPAPGAQAPAAQGGGLDVFVIDPAEAAPAPQGQGVLASAPVAPATQPQAQGTVAAPGAAAPLTVSTSGAPASGLDVLAPAGN